MTLVEVLMAVFILGIAVAGLLQALSQCAAAFTIARRTQELHNVLDAAEIVHPVLFEEDPVNALAVPSDSSIAEGYTFTRECEEDEDEDGLYLVTSTVKADGGGWGSTLVVRRYIYYAETRKK
jgi:Tfp pilus assembly protein PilV